MNTNETTKIDFKRFIGIDYSWYPKWDIRVVDPLTGIEVPIHHKQLTKEFIKDYREFCGKLNKNII